MTFLPRPAFVTFLPCRRAGARHVLGSYRPKPARPSLRGRAAQDRFAEEDTMATSVKQMMEAANAAVPRVTPAQAREMIAKGNTLVVDVRDAPEVEKSGKVAGAVHVSRGMLEFRADPESPYHDKNFAKDKTVIVYCASGGRSALSGKVLKDLGYGEVYNLGAFKDWAESGGPVDKVG
jgi:rhodanese-related sulfurtransferase